MVSQRLCFVTGSRAEYGLLRPLLGLAESDPGFEVSLLVTGAHLSSEFGSTYREIEQDGFAIGEKVVMVLSSDTPSSVVKSMGLGLIGCADSLPRLAPDAVVILGDRYEAFCAATASHVLRIPIIHLHGGEVTEGAYDDAFRHSITKMASMHFVANEEYATRIKAMGEEPGRIFNVGAIGLDNLRTLVPTPTANLERELGIDLGRDFFLVTFHPATLDPDSAVSQVAELFAALDALKDVHCIITKANADDQGRAVNHAIDTYAAARPGKVTAVDSLGRQRYLSLMKICTAVVGNSSSGIIEAPTAGVPTVNIGDRQKGRMKAISVLDCKCKRDAILTALQRARTHQFRTLARQCENPYGDGHSVERVMDTLRQNFGILKKRKVFFDYWKVN